jgi:hypothetical protein
MVVIIEESEEIQENLLLTILSALGRNKHVSSFLLHLFDYSGVLIFFILTFYGLCCSGNVGCFFGCKEACQECYRELCGKVGVTH